MSLGLREEAKRSAAVLRMDNIEDSGDDGKGVPSRNVRLDPKFREPIGGEHQTRNGKT